MNNIKIFTENSKEAAIAIAGENLNKLLAEHLPNQPVLLLLSGGSCFNMLDYVGEKFLNQNLTITMLDERFSEDNEINNFLQLQKLDFYNLAQSKDVNFIGTLPRPKETKEDFLKRIQTNIKKWLSVSPQGKIFATIGMGEDGHTAGIFPMQNENEFNSLFNSEELQVIHDFGIPNTCKTRITSTLTFFKKIDFAIAFIVGEKKRQPFKKLIENKIEVHKLPIIGLYNIKQAQIFTDIE